MHLRASLVASLALSRTALLGCNFIMNPDGDGIIRCDNPDDCDVPLAAALDDERGQSRCAAGGGGGGGFTQSQDNKVCSVVDREDVSCNPALIAMAESSAVSKVYNDAIKQTGVYTNCATTGTEGCPPTGNSCNDGLVVRTYEALSGDVNNPTPSEQKVCAKQGAKAVAPNAALKGFDVLDQHCRSYFCDDSFVCARGSGSSSGWRCARCDPDEAYGDGGCGTLYLQGAPSTVYTSDNALSDQCEDKANFDKTDFGPFVPTPP